MTPAALYQRGQEVCHRADLLRREGEGMRREAIARALEETGGNQTEAAKLIGIKRNALVALTRRDRSQNIKRG